MAIRIQLRRDTSANWASVDPVLAEGEPGLDTDTGELKFGDGSTAWSSLPVFAGGGGGAVDSVNGDTGVVVLNAADVGAQAADADLTTLGAGGAGARTFLGLAIGTDVQAWDADLDTIAANGAPTALGLALLIAANAAAARTSLGVVIGTNVQAWDADLDAIAANGAPTAIGLALLIAANAAAGRTTLGLGTAATSAATDFIASTLPDAKGDILTATADNTPARRAVGADNSRLIADSAQATGLNWEEKKHYLVAKTANETVNNSNALQDDDELLFTGLPTGYYQLEANIYLQAAAAAADWQFAFNFTGTISDGAWYGVSSGASSAWGIASAAQAPISLAGAYAGAVGLIMGSLNNSAAAAQGALLRGYFVVTVSGDLKFRWAQNTADPSNSRVLKGSNLIVTKVG